MMLRRACVAVVTTACNAAALCSVEHAASRRPLATAARRQPWPAPARRLPELPGLPARAHPLLLHHAAYKSQGKPLLARPRATATAIAAVERPSTRAPPAEPIRSPFASRGSALTFPLHSPLLLKLDRRSPAQNAARRPPLPPPCPTSQWSPYLRPPSTPTELGNGISTSHWCSPTPLPVPHGRRSTAAPSSAPPPTPLPAAPDLEKTTSE